MAFEVRTDIFFTGERSCCQTCRAKERVTGVNMCAIQIMSWSPLSSMAKQSCPNKGLSDGTLGSEGSTPHPSYYRDREEVHMKEHWSIAHCLTPTRCPSHCSLGLSHSEPFFCPSPDAAPIKSIPKLPPRRAHGCVTRCATERDEGTIARLYRGSRVFFSPHEGGLFIKKKKRRKRSRISSL